MERETRTERLYEALAMFLNNDAKDEWSIVLYNGEVKKLRRHLSQMDIPAEIISENKVSAEKTKVTIRKDRKALNM